MKGTSGNAPLVTGISPHQGTPGTLVVIRGERLGEGPSDLIALIICESDCLMTAKWKSPSKILARLGQAKRGSGDIIIITRSGGRGQSNVQFRVFIEQIGPLQESTAWVDEMKTVPARNVLRNSSEPSEADDLLGLHIDQKLDHALLSKIFPDSSGNIRMDNFSPSWCLIENYKSASRATLAAGLMSLKSKIEKERETEKNTQKTNLCSLINCVDSLTKLHSKIAHEGEKANNLSNKTASILRNIGFAKSAADKLFADVLARKDRADAARNVLSMITRFKFIFFLSESIDENTSNEGNTSKIDFSAILNDYVRAKTLFKDTDVQIFREVMEMLDVKVETLKEAIQKKIVDLSIPYDDQRKLIKYLQILDPESDPTWDCLVAYHCWLENLLWQLQQKYFSLTLKDTSTLQDFNPAYQIGDSVHLPHNPLQVVNIPQYAFVAELLSLLNAKLHSFLQLAHSFSDSVDKCSSERHNDIDQMLTNTINVGSWLLLNVLVPTSLPEEVLLQYKEQFVNWPKLTFNISEYLIQSLNLLRDSIKSLLANQFTRTHLQPLIELCTTIRIKCLGVILQRTALNIISLGLCENWKTNSVTKSPRTNLPDLYETEINEQLDYISIILSHENYSQELDLFVKDRIRKIVVDLFIELLLSIKDCYDKLFVPDQKRPDKLSFDVNSDVKPANSQDLLAKKLLLTINNIEHVINHSLTTLCRRFGERGVKLTDVILKKSRQKLTSYNQHLISVYISLKTSNIVSIIETAEYRHNLNDDVSDYIKEIVMCVVFVQAEVLLYSPQFINQIISSIVEFSLTQIIQLFHNVDFNANNCHTQVIVDLTAFEDAFSDFLDSNKCSVLNSIRVKLMGELSQEIFRLSMFNFRTNLKMALSCLHSWR